MFGESWMGGMVGDSLRSAAVVTRATGKERARAVVRSLALLLAAIGGSPHLTGVSLTLQCDGRGGG